MTAIWQCVMAISITTARRHDPASFIRRLRALDVHTQAGYEDRPRYVLIVWSKWIDDQKMILEYALLFDLITRSFREIAARIIAVTAVYSLNSFKCPAVEPAPGDRPATLG